MALAYTATQDVTMDGQPRTLKAFDLSVWKRDPSLAEGWICSVHSETPAGDPFGGPGAH